MSNLLVSGYWTPDRGATQNWGDVDVLLDLYVFESIEHVQLLTDEWRIRYNHERPHESLGCVPPLGTCRDQQRAETLVIECVLDGETYGN
jgi:transposase InsO family protein